MPDLLGRREIGFPSAGVKINEMIAYHVHTRGFVLVYTCIKSSVRILYQRYARRRAFITKTRTAILFTNTTLNRLGFGVTATGHFHFRNNETEDMLVYQSNPVEVELFSYVNTFVAHWVYVTHFVPRNLGERSKTTHFLL